MSGLLIGVPSTSRVQIEDVDYLLKVAKVIVETERTSYIGCFRVRDIIHPPPISVLDAPIMKPFEVVIVHSPRFCLVYLDGLHVGNYPSKICHDFWIDFGPFGFFPEIRHLSSVLSGALASTVTVLGNQSGVGGR